MSGVELYLAIVGLLGTVTMPAVQESFSAKKDKAKNREPRAYAKTIAELHGTVGEEWFSSVFSNLEMYQQEVEPNVDGKDRAFAESMRKNIYRVIASSRETAKELHDATKSNNPSTEYIQRKKDELEEYAKYLNHFQVSMMHRLLLRKAPRTRQDGRVFFVESPTGHSISSDFTLTPDIKPIQVGYKDDPQLNWDFSKKDVSRMRELLDASSTDPGPTSRPSRALLLACQDQLPEIVELCLEYSADPTVMGDDGLGAIHNALGTKDLMRDEPKIVQILTLLLDQGLDPTTHESREGQLTPLHRAATTRNVSATEFLLQRNPDMVNLVDKDGKTALYHACETPSQKEDLVRLLLDRNANFADKDPPPMPGAKEQRIAKLIKEQRQEQSDHLRQ